MEYGITFLAFLILYVIALGLNPVSRIAIQRVALIKYNDKYGSHYRLTFSKSKILKELLYTKNLNHIDIHEDYEEIFFFDRNYLLKSYDGNHIRFARDETKLEIINDCSVGFLNVYNKYALSRFVSFVKGDYENDSQQG